MELPNYINIRVRGLVQGQAWQSSWNLGVERVVDDFIGDWQFEQSLLLNWFNAYWYGGGNVPVGGGISDLLLNMMPNTTSIQSVRVLARNQPSMQTPVQLELFGNLVGLRPTNPDAVAPSYIAASFLARKDDYGGKGASMRLPVGLDTDFAGQNWLPAFITEMQTFGDKLVSNAIDSDLFVISNNVPAQVDGIKGVVVEHVTPPPPTGITRKEFPYEAPRVINAYTLTGWTVHPWVSTQNSRKIGRGI